MTQPDVSIILVNYNTTDLLCACIKSIQENSGNVKIEILIIDNASIISPKELLQAAYPEVILIESKENTGFSRANNIGIRAARGKYILLLNSDTLLIENTLERCINYMNSMEDNQIGVLGCKLLNADLSLQYSFHWSAATFKKVVQENAFYNVLFKNRIAKEESEKINQLHQQTAEVEWLSGAFLFMNREICLKHNFLLDEDFFMYSEDVELCRRVKKSGFKIVYFPETGIVHLGGGGTNVPLKRSGQLLLSEWLCILKSKGKIGLIMYLLLWRLNQLIDHLFFLKNKLLKRNTLHDKRQYLRRQFDNAVFKKYIGTFIFRYSSKPNSNKQFLKYDAK